MQAKIIAAVFCGILGFLAISNLLSPDRSFSESENRYLQQRPVFSLSELFQGTYTEDVESYIIDQFVARDTWVGWKTLSELALQRGSSNGVYFASDQYLIEAFDEIDLAQYQKNISYVADFSKQAAEELAIDVQTMLIPTASAVLSQKLPAFAPEVDQEALLNYAREHIPHFVDVSAALNEHREEYIYYRTDHHWTSLGAFYAYDSWRVQGNKKLSHRKLNDFQQIILSESFYGTTYSKASLHNTEPDVITAFTTENAGRLSVVYNEGESVSDSLYEVSFLEKKDKYAVFLNANQSVIHISTQENSGRRLLLVKDSYANCFVQMLLEDYDEIIVIDPRYFRSPVVDYARENDVTDILVLYNLKGFSSDLNLFYLTR